MTVPNSSGQRRASMSHHSRLQPPPETRKMKGGREKCARRPLTSFSHPFDREKAKWKERDEAWLKIENLAKSNPKVLTFPSGGKTTYMTPALHRSHPFTAFKQPTHWSLPLCAVSDVPQLCSSRQTSGHGDRRAPARRCQHAEENCTGRSQRGQEVTGAQSLLVGR